MFWVFVWVCCGLLGALIMGGKDQAGTGCLLGIIGGPLGVIAAAFMRSESAHQRVEVVPPSADPPTAPVKKCPMCAEMVLDEARKCRYCGHLFDAPLT